jgi:3-methyladenine DNA glycosylase AlkD
MSDLKKLQKSLYENASKEDFKPVFFKTGPGDYAEHDKFIGVSVPVLKKIAKNGKNLSFDDIAVILKSPINEERQLALFILIEKYQKTDDKEEIYQFFIKHIPHVNNWNLVDSAAPPIIGAHLLNQDKSFLLKLAKSKLLWERRIAIVATYYFIRNRSLDYTLTIAEILLHDSHDLIHKAVGWMLREVGKKDQAVLEQFLDKYGHDMPRTMLRYAIERFPKEVRNAYLKKKLK